ncbi:MAG TPA: globin [Candidatus Xenobia bacterium]|jgi:hemoglobin
MNDGEVFEAVGGEEAFVRLVDAFYRGVESDPPLRALYPEDLAPGKQHLAWFLMERFGGPSHFSSRRGHPRLRMRHFRFAVTQEARDAWMQHMRAAVQEAPEFAPARDLLLAYFEDAASFLINQ